MYFEACACIKRVVKLLQLMLLLLLLTLVLLVCCVICVIIEQDVLLLEDFAMVNYMAVSKVSVYLFTLM